MQYKSLTQIQLICSVPSETPGTWTPFIHLIWLDSTFKTINAKHKHKQFYYKILPFFSDKFLIPGIAKNQRIHSSSCF